MWRLARATGQTPWEALHDPHRAFNLTVMRAHDKARSMRLGLLLQGVTGDDFGVGRIITTLRLLYEDG